MWEREGGTERGLQEDSQIRDDEEGHRLVGSRRFIPVAMIAVHFRQTSLWCVMGHGTCCAQCLFFSYCKLRKMHMKKLQLIAVIAVGSLMSCDVFGVQWS